jgi:mRNA interferase HigB
VGAKEFFYYYRISKIRPMLLLNSKMLYEFGLEHAPARKSLAAWQKTVEEANWNNRQDVLTSFPKAKMIRNNRARF